MKLERPDDLPYPSIVLVHDLDHGKLETVWSWNVEDEIAILVTVYDQDRGA